MNRRASLALAVMAGIAAASAPGADVIPTPPTPKTGYQPGDFRWRKVKGSYSRTLAKRLAAKTQSKTRDGNG
jgi:hypothetical protein